jgi:hypothetical protein
VAKAQEEYLWSEAAEQMEQPAAAPSEIPPFERGAEQKEVAFEQLSPPIEDAYWPQQPEAPSVEMEQALEISPVEVGEQPMQTAEPWEIAADLGAPEPSPHGAIEMEPVEQIEPIEPTSFEEGAPEIVSSVPMEQAAEIEIPMEVEQPYAEIPTMEEAAFVEEPAVFEASPEAEAPIEAPVFEEAVPEPEPAAYEEPQVPEAPVFEVPAETEAPIETPVFEAAPEPEPAAFEEPAAPEPAALVLEGEAEAIEVQEPAPAEEVLIEPPSFEAVEAEVSAPPIPAGVKERIEEAGAEISKAAGLSSIPEELLQLIVDKIEKIAWEVIPQIAEAVVTERIEKLEKKKQG